MKSAVVTGSTGFLGNSIANYFSSIGVETLCLGRSKINESTVISKFGVNSKYMQIPMQNIGFLASELKRNLISLSEPTVFFHFAWEGKENLTDGTLNDQIKNSVYTANAVRVAKQIGCIKFVNCGSLEETFTEMQLSNVANLNLTQMNYSIGKLASRDIGRLTAYLEKIDYVHTRLSMPLSRELNKLNYLETNLRKIRLGEEILLPTNDKLFDIISIQDVVEAYYLVGEKGKNKSDYFIGTGSPNTLINYFGMFKDHLSDKKSNSFCRELSKNESKIFSIKEINLDTNFSPKHSIFEKFESIG